MDVFLKPVKVNLGCGARSRSGWLNFDSVRSAHIIAHDLRKPVPVADGSVDFVYMSHVFEHFPRAEGGRLLCDVLRILKPGGILRVVVPDLELLARNYLGHLEQAYQISDKPSVDQEWAVLSMFDQVARGQPGGEMPAFLRLHPASALQNVFAFEGPEIRSLHETVSAGGGRTSPGRRAKAKQIIRTLLAPLRAETWLSRSDREALAVGRFRLSGEVHYWMYDELTLCNALMAAGLTEPVRYTADQSSLPNWASENLDTEPDGSVYKPTSLFMEACKPFRPTQNT